jgi:uncharacterized protein YjbI with pentapeptide repeats
MLGSEPGRWYPQIQERMNTTTAAEVWARLVGGGPLDELDLPKVDGRTDLRGLKAAAPSVARRFISGGRQVEALEGITEIRGRHWKGIDFSNSRLNALRFHDSQIEDCVFDGARCKGWSLWGTTVVNTSFRSSDLRDAGLGITVMGERNAYRNVDFTNADLRETVHLSSDMVDCLFCDTKLARVDFQGTIFVNCRFEGELADVLFYERGFRGEKFPPNEMRGVDLRRARLLFVGFRGLNMDSVAWPEGDEHIIIDDYPATLDKVIAILRTRSDDPSKGLAGLLADSRKWVGPQQKKGVVSKLELREIGGDAIVIEFLKLCEGRG